MVLVYFVKFTGGTLLLGVSYASACLVAATGQLVVSTCTVRGRITLPLCLYSEWSQTELLRGKGQPKAIVSFSREGLRAQQSDADTCSGCRGLRLSAVCSSTEHTTCAPTNQMWPSILKKLIKRTKLIKKAGKKDLFYVAMLGSISATAPHPPHPSSKCGHTGFISFENMVLLHGYLA